MTDLVVREQAVMDRAQLQEIATTDFIPKALRNNLPAIMACVATGRALGIPDMAALRSIHIVDGKATFSAELMVSLVRRAGHSITGKVSADKVEVRGKRGDNGDELVVEWTMEMAQRAGLKGKQNWAKYPEAMLWARAVSQLCRMLFPDVFIGATYTPEEIGADATDEHGVPVEEITGEVVEPSADSHDSWVSADTLGNFAPKDVPPEEVPMPQPRGEEPQAEPEVKLATEARKKKLNVLVGQLRKEGRDPTLWMYEKVGRVPEIGEDGEVHYAPLRDRLTNDEASMLIDELQKFAEKLKQRSATQEPQEASGQFPIPEAVQQELAARES